MPDLSIVILSWNVREMLAACLRALPEALGDWRERAETLVVDNASSDGSAPMVLRDFPGVRVLALTRNLGFSSGNNVGIGEARGRLIFLLNPDTLPLPGSIAALCSYMEANPDVGIAGPRLLNADGTLQPSRRRLPTLLTGFVESTPLQRLAPNLGLLRRYYMSDRSDDETQDVGWLSGAALMCKREALEGAGSFDSGYFMFSEELDLCRRVGEAGWRISYLPEARIVHYGGSSTAQDVPARHINFSAGKVRYYRKHFGPVAGRLLRLYLLCTYAGQLASEAAKFALGHKRSLRLERVRLYARVLASGLQPTRAPVRRLRGTMLITGEYPPAMGGVGDYTCRLGEALEAEGVRRRVLTQPVQGVGSHSAGGDVSPRDVPLEVPRFSLGRVLPLLRGSGVGVAHIQYQTGAYGMRPAINLLPLMLRLLWRRGRVVVTFHDLRVPYLFPKAGPLREWANRVMARAAHAAVATNPEDAATLRRWGVRRVETIPIGSNIRNSPPLDYSREVWRESRGVGPDTVLLAYFGFLNNSKGLGDLLHALAGLHEEGDYRLLMVGGGLGSSDPTNRATAEEIRSLAARLGIAERLIWTGYLSPPEVSAALLSADIAVLPFADGASFRRGSLLAVLEHGLPLVTTVGPGAGAQGLGTGEREWPRLEDGVNALLVPVGDRETLVVSIRRAAGEPGRRERLGDGALRLAGRFGWNTIATRHKKMYSSLQASHSSSPNRAGGGPYGA